MRRKIARASRCRDGEDGAVKRKTVDEDQNRCRRLGEGEDVPAGPVSATLIP